MARAAPAPARRSAPPRARHSAARLGTPPADRDDAEEYTDYAAAQKALAYEVSSDPNGSVLQDRLTAAANACWSALAGAAAAKETVIEAPLALDKKLVERGGKQQTRNTNAAAVAPVLP